jgi:hypothetical protein
MVQAFVIYAIASAILAWLLMHTSGLSYLERAWFVGISAFAGALIARLTDWNWHGYSASYTVVHIADALIGWTLVGLAVAAIV